MVIFYVDSKAENKCDAQRLSSTFDIDSLSDDSEFSPATALKQSLHLSPPGNDIDEECVAKPNFQPQPARHSCGGRSR